MTRNKRIAKLGNAIQEFRGVYYEHNKKWKRPPNPAKWANIVKWCDTLGLNPGLVIDRVRGFKSFTEYQDWIKTII